MAPDEAAKSIIKLYGEFQRISHKDDGYAEAVAMACEALSLMKIRSEPAIIHTPIDKKGRYF